MTTLRTARQLAVESDRCRDALPVWSAAHQRPLGRAGVSGERVTILSPVAGYKTLLMFQSDLRGRDHQAEGVPAPDGPGQYNLWELIR